MCVRFYIAHAAQSSMYPCVEFGLSSYRKGPARQDRNFRQLPRMGRRGRSQFPTLWSTERANQLRVPSGAFCVANRNSSFRRQGTIHGWNCTTTVIMAEVTGDAIAGLRRDQPFQHGIKCDGKLFIRQQLMVHPILIVKASAVRSCASRTSWGEHRAVSSYGHRSRPAGVESSRQIQIDSADSDEQIYIVQGNDAIIDDGKGR